MRGVLLSSVLVLGVVSLACGGKSSPTGPSSTTTTTIPPVTPATITLTGHLTATNGGQALSGVQAIVGASTSLTDGAGAFRAELAPGGSLRLALTGSGIVPRSLSVATATTRDVSLTAIGLSGGFDLGFYRQLVRNGFEAPATLQPLRRWTQTPNIYLRTVDDDGVALDAKTLDTTDAIIREMVPIWTAGTFGAVMERGAGSRDGVLGWITVHWQSIHNAPIVGPTLCGDALVGANPGSINFKYAGACRCTGTEIRPRTVRHELGHALGFWHTGNRADLLSGVAVADCDQRPSARELAAAAIAYTRPIGNLDPDSDPPSSVALSPMMVR